MSLNSYFGHTVFNFILKNTFVELCAVLILMKPAWFFPKPDDTFSSYSVGWGKFGASLHYTILLAFG